MKSHMVTCQKSQKLLRIAVLVYFGSNHDVPTMPGRRAVPCEFCSNFPVSMFTLSLFIFDSSRIFFFYRCAWSMPAERRKHINLGGDGRGLCARARPEKV